MDDKKQHEVGLFRFSLIAPLVNETYEALSKNDFFRQVASKEHTLPNGKKVRFCSHTIKKWYLEYTHHGFDGLIPKVRCDIGSSRALSADAIAMIHELKGKFPYITGTLVYQKLIEEGYVKESTTSLATVLRYIRENNLKRNQIVPIERKAFEMEFANDCWQSDSSHGPVIKVDNVKRKTFLIIFLDDASRMILHGEFFFNDNSVNLQSVFKKSIAKYGIPKKVFVDNGSGYRNEQLGLICASLGSELVFAKPYTPESKGKIERMFRTIKDKWMNGIDWNTFDSLQSLNEDFNKFINKNYTNNIHSAINDTPRERFLQDINKIKSIDSNELDKHFLHRVIRKVSSDCTIKLNTISFEVPAKYIGQRINIRYSPISLDKAFIFNNNNEILDTVYQLKRVDNSKVKRNSIDYNLINGGTNDV